MKKYVFISMASTLLFFTSCTITDDPINDDENNPQVEETSDDDSDDTTEKLSATYTKIKATILDFPDEDLDDDEIAGLMKMREEEKLARDVYEYFYEKYEMKIFGNIAESEKTHMFAVKAMIDKYQLEDPADNSPAGEFKSNDLQEIYDLLITKGNTSLTEALIVGAIIEDLDIADLDELLTKTSNQDLKYVYENLNLGSRNHLRAFYPQVINNNGEYTPQYISQEEFDSILSSTKEYGTW